MGLVIAFAVGLLLGIALGVSITMLVTWSHERLDKQRGYAEYVQEIRSASENLKGLFTDEIGHRREAFGRVAQQLQVTEHQTQELLRVTGALQASRDYVSPSENTVDCALLFIPNEQVFSFINVHDPRLFDDALKGKVVLCSPWTLYPVLSVIRLALDHFLLERTTRALFPVLAGFEKQWQAFHESLEKMGRRLADAQREFDQLMTTRQRQLDRVLAEIDTLRHTPEDLSCPDREAGAGQGDVMAVEAATVSGECAG
jgi:hypothetical protein